MGQKHKRKKSKKKTENKSLFAHLGKKIKKAYQFIEEDMWQSYQSDVSSLRGKMIHVLKVLYIAVMEFIDGNVPQKASALTYTTILSIVPLLAILMSIAASFGVQGSVQAQLFKYFPAHQNELMKGIEFAGKYLEQIKSSFIIGFGILFLLWAVISLLSSIEDTINDIWHIRISRSWGKRIFGYFAAFIILPVLMTLTSGCNLFISSLSETLIFGAFSLSPLITFVLHLISYLIVIGIFTCLFIIFPNTKVSFFSGLIGGLVAGTAFQIFQWIYISGILWAAKYNAIYGSFAAIPLLFMFMQLSWMICLFGAQLSYAIDNVNNYAFKNERDNVSRRYKDFVALIICKKIALAFRDQQAAPSATTLSEETCIPVIIVRRIIEALKNIEIIREIPVKNDPYEPVYMPNMDIHELTCNFILVELYKNGYESFSPKTRQLYKEEWSIIEEHTKEMRDDYSTMNVMNI